MSNNPAAWVAPDYSSQSQSGTSYPANIDAALAAAFRLANMFCPHQQDQGSPAPDLTVRVEAGAIWNAGTLTEIAAQTVSGFTTPSAGQHRVDRVVMDPTTGVCSRVAGTAVTGSPSAVAPAITAGSVPVCQVLITSADTAITNSMITDERQTFDPHMSGAATEQAWTSGTSLDFTIPGWATEIDVSFDQVSTNGVSPIIIQIGDAGGIENAGYAGGCSDRGADAFNSTGFLMNRVSVAARIYSGSARLVRKNTNTWTQTGTVGTDVTSAVQSSGGAKTLSAGPIASLRITTVGGTDAGDSGSIGVKYRR